MSWQAMMMGFAWSLVFWHRNNKLVIPTTIPYLSLYTFIFIHVYRQSMRIDVRLEQVIMPFYWCHLLSRQGSETAAKGTTTRRATSHQVDFRLIIVLQAQQLCQASADLGYYGMVSKMISVPDP